MSNTERAKKHILSLLKLYDYIERKTSFVCCMDSEWTEGHSNGCAVGEAAKFLEEN